MPPLGSDSRPTTQPTTAVYPAVTDEQIGLAITRGVDFLLSNIEHSQLKPLEGEGGAVDHAGLNALCIDALLEAERATRDPRLKLSEPMMKALLVRLKQEELKEKDGEAAPLVFAHSLRAAALAVNNRLEDHDTLEADVAWLVRAQHEGAYTFDDQFPGQVRPENPNEKHPVIWHGTMGMPTQSARSFTTPTSLDSYKFGVYQSFVPLRPYLGASYHPIINIPDFTTYTVVRESRGPGFARLPDEFVPRRPVVRANPTSGPTTRTAVQPSQYRAPDSYPWDATDSELGLLGVWAGAEAGIDVPESYWQSVQKHWLQKEFETGTWSYDDHAADASIGPTFAGTWALCVTDDWLRGSQKASALGFPPYNAGLVQAIKWMQADDHSVTIKDEQTNFVGYNLFLLARLGQACGWKFFGTHDWYRELASRVVPLQWPTGAFGRTFDGYDAVVQTAYTVIFLATGRHPIFMEKLQFPGAWCNRPRDVSSLTRFASHELERSLNWEVVPWDHDYTDWLDSRLLFIASHEAPSLGQPDFDKLRGFVNAGGVIFTQADHNSARFNEFIEQKLVPGTFLGLQMQDIPGDDPIYSALYKLDSKNLKLRGVKNGSRWALIHSPVDLAHHWQARDLDRASFELAVNLFIYANGRSEPRNRLAAGARFQPTSRPANN